MNHTLPRVLILGLLAGVSTAMAQADLSYLFTSRPKYFFSAGINIRSGGPSVKFSHIGSLPRGLFDSTTFENIYDDGTVGQDRARPDESLSTTKFNADKTRYQVFKSDGTVAADELAYQQGQTRIWSVDSASQVNGDQVDFHLTSAKESGATADGPGKSSGGFDLQLARDIGFIGKKASWGISFSIGMNDISSKSSKTVSANELIYTGSYKLNGTIPSGDTSGTGGVYYNAPSPPAFAQGQGGVEDTVTISQGAIAANDTATLPGTKTGTQTIVNQATVAGSWKIKGAYYLMRLGPSFRYYASKHFSFSTNAGLAGAYAGSDFDIDETLITPKISTLSAQPTFVGTDHKREFKIGAYIEANAEYWITFRTGLYAGAVYETLGSYKHTFNDAVADVDIGSGLNFRVGLITRF